MDMYDEFLNYNIIKGKAYTEDHVLVYNLFIENIAKEISEVALLEYFQKFGNVRVHLLNVRNENVYNRKPRIGFANFKDPLSAAKVLKKRYHKIYGNTINVKACHSWLQPDAQPGPTSAASAADEMETNVASLLNLNDDCLDVIFQHLEIKDQINLGKCCYRLRDVFHMRVKADYKVLDLKNMHCLTLWQIRNFLQMAGTHIVQISGDLAITRFKSIIELIGKYCINAKIINMSGKYLTQNILLKLLRNTHLVEELYLDDCKLKDGSILVLKRLKNLKILSLDRNYDLTGCEVKCLTSIRHLSLNSCTGILRTYFKQICENLKDLKYLDIRKCLSLNRDSILAIVQNLHKLQTIKIFFDIDQIDRIASLPCLKNLYLRGDRYAKVPLEIFKGLANFQADQLEILEIPYAIDLPKVIFISALKNLKEIKCPWSDNLNDNCLQHLSKLQNLESLDIQNCIAFSAAGLLNLITKCKKLTTLNLSHCRQLDVTFVTKLFALLIEERRQNEKNNPLKLFSCRKDKSRFAIQSPEFEEASDILFISYEIDLPNGFSALDFSDVDCYFCDEAAEREYRMYVLGLFR